MSDDLAHVNFYLEDEFIVSFGYPANVPGDIAILDEHIASIKDTTEYVVQALAALLAVAIEEMPEHVQDMETTEWDVTEQRKLHFLLCLLMKFVCEGSEEQPEAGKSYNFAMDGSDDEMDISIYAVDTIH